MSNDILKARDINDIRIKVIYSKNKTMVQDIVIEFPDGYKHKSVSFAKDIGVINVDPLTIKDTTIKYSGRGVGEDLYKCSMEFYGKLEFVEEN